MRDQHGIAADNFTHYHKFTLLERFSYGREGLAGTGHSDLSPYEQNGK
jgi:hypothetical protein